MKKILALVLALAMVLSFAACGKKEEAPAKTEYKLGMGVVVSLDSSADKTADKNAKAEAVATVATVVFANDGKIAGVEIDCADTTIEISNGKIVGLENVDLRTKYEKKGDYGMVAYNASPIGKEWFEQVDAFEAWCVGKTLAEVTAASADDTDLKAGCTIAVTDFVAALKKAVEEEQAVTFSADTFKLGLDVLTDVSGSTDKNDKGDATAKFASTFAAAAVDAEGKVLAAIVDEIEPTVSVDDKGVVSAKKYTDTKRNLKENYGMVAYNASPIGKEWYEQANAFSAYLVGKTATEITAIPTSESGSATADVADLSAVCTIKIANYIKVAADAVAAAK